MVADRLNKLRTDIEDTYQAINEIGGTIPSDKNTNNIPEAIRSVYDNLPKVSDTGTNVSLSPTLKGRLGIVPKGNTLQDGTPTPDTPVEIQSATGTQKVVVSGKNLFDINEIERTNNATIELNDDGFTYTRTSASSGDLFVATLSKQLKSNTTYSTYMTKDTSNSLYFYADKLFGNSLQRNQIAYSSEYIAYTFTTDSTGHVVIGFYSTNSSQGGTGTIGNIVLTEGVKTIEELQKYQPYQEPQEVDIELSSRNLFDKDSITNNYYYNASGNYVAVNETYLSDYINANANESYTLQTALASTTKRVNYFDSNKNWLSQINTGNADYTFTTPNNTKYIRISFNASVNKNNVQLVEGSTAPSTYIPYYNYSLNKIGDYEDYIDGTPDNWVLYKKTREISLNISDMNNAENYPGWKNINIIKEDYPDSQSSLNGLCNITSTNKSPSPIVINTKSTNAIIYLNPNIFALTQTQWKEQYPNLVFELVYGLQEYEQTPITEENLVSQLNELYYLQSYNDTTNIDVTGNLPMRITASAIKGE